MGEWYPGEEMKTMEAPGRGRCPHSLCQTPALRVVFSPELVETCIVFQMMMMELKIKYGVRHSPAMWQTEMLALNLEL